MELKLKFKDKENNSYELILEESNLTAGQVKLRNILTGEEKLFDLNALTESTEENDKKKTPEWAYGIH